MTTCSQCSTEIPNTSRFCLCCGSAVKSNSATSASTIAISISSSSHPANFDEGRFVPGTLLAERYRILGRLGKGGMGEVYRANDLRLGQTVALKFLPEATAKDPAMLARFYNEVRIARQVTHPNVCRVYDIGDVDGQPFISMQFVDGENLSSLLLRIGRLPADKAVEISRRLCAGLAAAHSQSVLHRDLKPANIMIDGRGQVLIADFGLSGLAGEIPTPEMVAAAGAKEGLRPVLAIACLAAILVPLGAIIFVYSNQMLAAKVNFEMPPEALAVQAHKTIQQFGYTGPVADRTWGF